MDRFTQRRRGRRTVVGVAVGALLGWALTGLSTSPAAALVVHTTEGLTVVDAATGEALLDTSAAAISPDGSVFARTSRLAGDRTRLVIADASTGAQRWSTTVEGDWSVHLVAWGGEAAVLGTPRQAGSSIYLPEGRDRTRLLLARPGGSRRYDLAGNLEPEAFSLGTGSLFVISYTPALAPARYQVRRLDLDAGEVVDVFTPDAELQQEMGGTARTQAASADGTRLYTLYALDAADGSQHAFVHVLNLVEGQLWAHCVDLPEGFTASSKTALAVSPDGDRLFVADAAVRRIAEVDTDELVVMRTAAFPPQMSGSPGQISAAVGEDGTLFMAGDRLVLGLTGGSLEPLLSYWAPDRVMALQAGPRGQLYVAAGTSVVVLDRAGSETAALKIPLPITGLGASFLELPEDFDKFQCAC